MARSAGPGGGCWELSPSRGILRLRTPFPGAPLKAELMTPAGFLSHHAHVLKDIPQWHERPEDVIEKDPRYIAYRCGWDLLITQLGFWRTFVQARTGPPKASRYTSKIDIDEFGNLYDTIEDSGDEVSGLEFCEPEICTTQLKIPETRFLGWNFASRTMMTIARSTEVHNDDPAPCQCGRTPRGIIDETGTTDFIVR